MSYLLRHIAPVSAKPSSRAPSFASVDEPRVVGPHRRPDLVPGVPEGHELLRVPARRHPPGDLLEREAVLRALETGPAAPVCAVEARREARQLRAPGRVRRRREVEREADLPELARRLRRNRDAAVPLGLLRELRRGCDEALGGEGREGFRVLRDEVRLDPAGAARLDAEVEEPLLGLVDELHRLRGRGAGGGRLGGRRSGEAGGESEGENRLRVLHRGCSGVRSASPLSLR